MVDIRHPRKHGLDSSLDHKGIPDAVVNELMKFDANGLPAISKLKHVHVTRSVPSAGLDYVEIGKFTQSKGSFALLISVASEDSVALRSGADLYYIVGQYNETTGAWQLAYPLQTIEPHSQLCVMITNDELHLRLIAITSTPSPVPVNVQMIEMGVGDAVFTAASGTGTMTLPTTEFPSTLISQVGGKIQAHAEMSMNTEKITDVVDPVSPQDVATKNYADSVGIPKGTSFPGSPSDDELFNRTDLGMIFRYDGTRVKWLSEHSEILSCGRGVVSDIIDAYCGVANAPMSATSGFRMPRNGTIVAVTVENQNTVSRTIDFRVNNSTVNRVQLVLTAAKGGKVDNANQDFSIDSLLQVLALAAAGEGMTNMIATIEVKWRA